MEGMSPQDLEASVRGVADAPEPGTARVATMREILSQMEDDLAVPNVGELKRGHGYAFIWDTRTYERSVISKNLLAGALTWRREDRSFFYTTSQPKDGNGILLFPWRGDKKCLLHPEHPNVQHYKHLGLPECRKSNIPSEYMVMMHIQHKHSDAWNIIKSEKEEVERTEDRAERKAMIEEMVRRGGVSPVVVDEVIAATDPDTADVPEQIEGAPATFVPGFVPEVNDVPIPGPNAPTKPMIQKPCPACDFVSESTSNVGAGSRLRGHKNREHGGG